MTDLQAPAPPTAPADLPTRPRRRRRLVTGLVVAGLAAATVTAGLVTGVVGPSRLVEGPASGVRVLQAAPAGSEGDAVVRPDGVDQVTNTYGTEYRVDVAGAGWLVVTASLTNDSPVPVRVTSLSTPLADGGRLDVLADLEVAVVGEVDGLGWRPLADGVVVRPDESYTVRVTGRLDATCDREGYRVDGSGAVLTDQVLDVGYTVLGVPRRTSPTMSWTASLVGPFTLGC